MIKYLPLILLVFSLTACFESSSPNPVNKPSSPTGNGEWESSGADELPQESPELVANKDDLSSPSIGEICFSKKELKEKSSGFINSYNELKKIKPEPDFTLNSELLYGFSKNDISSDLNLDEDLISLINKLSLRAKEKFPDTLAQLKDSFAKISLTKEQLITSELENTLTDSNNNCLKISFSEKYNISPLGSDLNYESHISYFLFKKLSKFEKVYLVLSEAINIHFLNNEIESSFSDIHDITQNILRESKPRD